MAGPSGIPEKGGAGSALSILQGVKLKEITAKAKGKTRFGQRKPPDQGQD